MKTSNLKRGEEIRKFILDNVSNHPKNISSLTSREFEITRQAVNKHLKRLIKEQKLLKIGRSRNIKYSLVKTKKIKIEITKNLEEHVVYDDFIFPEINCFPQNIREIWSYGFTEMMNNAIDHSEGTIANLSINVGQDETEVGIIDNGVGIFEKIKSSLNLNQREDAILELSKGKLTTDPSRHSGEGIFFTSRVFDFFQIWSDHLIFSHDADSKFDSMTDLPSNIKSKIGTAVFMTLKNNSERNLEEIFSSFSELDDNEIFQFNKTVFPVRFARSKSPEIVSRSQAKRLMNRADCFDYIILDFDGISSVGQAFANEIFHVFVKQHPDKKVFYQNANSKVEKMLRREGALENQNLDKHS